MAVFRKKTLMFTRLHSTSVCFSPLKVILTTLSIVAFTEILFGKYVETGFKYLVLIPVIVLGATKAYLSEDKVRTYNYLKLLQIGIKPYIWAFAYSIVIFVSNYDSNYSVDRPLSITIRYIYAIVTTVAFLAIFNEQSVEQLLLILNTSYLITFMSAIYKIGLSNTVLYIFNIESQIFNSYFEAHTIGLTIGMLILYKILFSYENRFNLNTVLGLAVLYLCHKRIALIAFTVTLLIGIIIHKSGTRFSHINISFLLLLMFSGCAIFAFITSTGTLYDIFTSLGLNVTGRKLMVYEFSKMYTISPFFMGKGLGFTSLYLERIKLSMRYRNMRVFASILHNDIFRMYIELGFLGFFLWFRYYFRTIPKKLFVLYGDLTSKVYCVISIYAVFIYMTDNAMDYFIFQMSLFLCIGNALTKKNCVS